LSGSYVIPELTVAEAETTTTTKTANGAHPRVKADTKDAMVAEADSGDLSKWYGQQIPFNSLLASGALMKKADGTYTGDNGYTMR
jgi:chitinase